MNKIKERREQGAVCSVCKSPDYEYLGKEIKHEFKCKSCGRTWAYGRTESKYTRLA